jgi:hypothetical protein
MTAFYDTLLSLLPKSAVGRGEMEFCATGLTHCFAIKWTDKSSRISLVAVNLAPQRACFQVQGLAGYEIADVFSDGKSTWKRKGGILHIDLAACGFDLVELRLISR